MKNIFFKIGEAVALTNHVSKKVYASAKKTVPTIINNSREAFTDTKNGIVNASNEARDYMALGYGSKTCTLKHKDIVDDPEYRNPVRDKNNTTVPRGPVQMEMDFEQVPLQRFDTSGVLSITSTLHITNSRYHQSPWPTRLVMVRSMVRTRFSNLCIW